MHELKLINEQQVLGKQFRVYGTIEQPLFLAKDVAEWIEHSDVSTMLRKIDEDEKVKKICDTNNVCTTSKARDTQEMWFLTEDGLYEVLMQSRKPIAKQFKKKVKEILKSIRTTGGYIAGQESMSDEELMAKALLVAQKQIELKNKQILEMKPKAEFFDAVADCKTAISMNEVSKVLAIKGYGRNNLFEFLRNEGILDKYNTPYQRYVDCGWFRVIEQKFTKNGEAHVSTKTLVYQKGVDAIRKRIERRV